MANLLTPKEIETINQKIKKFRKGNYVYFNGNIVTIRQVTAKTIKIENNLGVFPYYTFQGILLKEDWLIKWNFVMSNDLNFERKLGDFRVSLDYDIIYFDKVLPAPKYVHEFQNLYEDFTGKKLI